MLRFIIAALFLIPLPTWASDSIIGAASIIDGDTIEVHGQRIRLHGIDAPESRQECIRNGESWLCGKDATQALADKVGSGLLECLPKDRDRYGRTVAVCRLDGEDLNAWIVREGWALAYRHYSLDYVADEDAAREAKRGIWASEFTPPWEWRRGNR